MDNIKEIAGALAHMSDTRLIMEFLNSILTPTELKNLSSRWEVVKLLDQGLSQRKIASMLSMSLCKITRGSKELKKENSVLKRMIQQINH